MSSAAGPGTFDPSARQDTDSHDTDDGSAPGYSDDAAGSAAAAAAAQQPTTGAGAAAMGQREAALENGDDADVQPVDSSLIAGGENLVGAANDVATGIDPVDANFSEEQDAPV